MFLVDGMSKSGAGLPTFAIVVAVAVSLAVSVAVAMCKFISLLYFLATESTEVTEKRFQFELSSVFSVPSVANSSHSPGICPLT